MSVFCYRTWRCTMQLGTSCMPKIKLGKNLYYPPGAPHLSDNKLFGMYHSNTPQHNKEVILSSLCQLLGVVRVVFATVALGMGVNPQNVNTIIHYGAPHSTDDCFQDSRRGGRSGSNARSSVYWKPADCPLKKDPVSTRDHEVAGVRRYLTSNICCHFWLLHFFDPLCTRVEQDENCAVICVLKLHALDW